MVFCVPRKTGKAHSYIAPRHLQTASQRAFTNSLTKRMDKACKILWKQINVQEQTKLILHVKAFIIKTFTKLSYPRNYKCIT